MITLRIVFALFVSLFSSLGWSAENLLQDKEDYQQQCDKGIIESCNRIGCILSDGGNKDEAKPWFKRACDGGMLVGCVNLGESLEHENLEEAKKVYKQACDGGAMGACSRLAVLLEKEGNTAEAKKLFTQACAGGDELGCVVLKKPIKRLTAKEYFSQAEEAYQVGDYDKAIEYLVKILERVPDDRPIKRFLLATYGKKLGLEQTVAQYGEGMKILPDGSVFVKDTGDYGNNVGLEYDYLSMTFGLEGKDWERREQSLIRIEGKPYDEIEVKILPSGETKIMRFDISDFYGK